MAFSLDIVKSQVIALLNLAERDAGTNLPVYGPTVSADGDTLYAQDEIDRAAADAANQIMRAICETDGHPHRALFTLPADLEHGEPLPEHYGSIGVPRIVPYAGGPTLAGKIASVEEIAAWRANPNGYYSAFAHDAAADGFPSRFSGRYAVDEAAQVFHFTGSSAESDLAWFQPEDRASLPDDYYPAATALCVAGLRKDGDVSDVFAENARMGQMELDLIRSRGGSQPSMNPTVGTRDNGRR